MALGLDQIVRERTDLSDAEADHLRALVVEWALLADLGFSDLVLWIPTWNTAGFVAAAQARPSTAPTQSPGDAVGRFLPRGRMPLLDRVSATRVIETHRHIDDPLVPVADEGIPILFRGRLIGLIVRQSGMLTGRSRGALEQVYLESADHLAEMVAEGRFPDPGAVSGPGETPRVGDGLVRLSPSGIVEFASPNAASALRRAGITSPLVGESLATVTAGLGRGPGPVDENLSMVVRGSAAAGAELDTETATVAMRAIPLRRRGASRGALLLVRDATELRRHERALLSKDATIREIHHRVKNNLQTVSALLRMQGRRVGGSDARSALAEAERRVASIAVVHEILAHTPGDTVEFDDVSRRLLALVADTATATNSARLVQSGTFGSLPGDVATPLSMVVAELLANAVEHGGGTATLSVARYPNRLVVDITDEGPGLPTGFNMTNSPRLGLSIVRTLVTEELHGSLELGPAAAPSGAGSAGADRAGGVVSEESAPGVSAVVSLPVSWA